MAKHSNENFYKRLKELAAVGSATKSGNLSSQTLVDYKRAADGTALGIIKENHNYFLKTSVKQGENLSVADFAYIGGIENRRRYQYDTVAKADKHRESHLGTISEALTFRDAEERKPMNESRELPSLEIGSDAGSFIKNRITDGKKKLNESFEDKFKSSLKPTDKSETKKGLLPESANLAIRKALGKINESAVVNADSKIKDSDVLADKTGGKGKPQAPVNDANAKSKANGGHSQPSDLSTSDSEAKEAEHVANKTGGKGKPQAPINDANAKSKADAAKSKSSKVHESNDLVTADSEIVDSDMVANKTGGKQNAQAPINDTNAKSKSTAGVSQPSDIVTADSEIVDGDIVADKTSGKDKPQAPINDTNAKTKANLGHSQPSDLVTSDSEIVDSDIVADKAPEKKEGQVVVSNDKKKSKVEEGVTVVGSSADQGTPLPNTKSNTSFGAGKLEQGTSFDANEDAIAEAVADAELDAAAKALQGLEMADASDDVAPEASLEQPVPMDDAPEAAPAANAETGGAPAPEAEPSLDGLGLDTPEASAAPDASAAPVGGAPEADAMDGGAEAGLEGGLDANTEGGTESPEAGLDNTGSEEGDIADDAEEAGVGKEIEKLIGKLGYKVRNTELTPEKTESSLNSIIAAFKNDLADVDLDVRKGIADRIIKLKMDDESSEDGSEVATDGEGDVEASLDNPLPGSEEIMGDAGSTPEFDETKANEAIDARVAKLSESGVVDDADEVEIDTTIEEPVGDDSNSFASYASSRGYDPENMNQASEEEVGSVISGWANDHGDDESQHQTIAIYLTPAIQQHLIDSGHGDLIEKLLPLVAGMGENQMAKFGAIEVMPQEDNVDNTIEEPADAQPSFAPPGQVLGAGIAKFGKSDDADSTDEKEVESEPTASNVDAEEIKKEEETEDVSESTKKLKQYIQMKLDERTGKKKAVLKEGKKSPTAILVERIIDEEITRLKKKLTENHQMTEQEIDEISLGGLFNAGKTLGNMGTGVVDNVVKTIEAKIQSATSAIKNAGETIVKSYHAGAKNAVIDDIEKMAVELGQLIQKVNASAVKAGEQPINAKSILATIQNQIASQNQVNLGKYKTQQGQPKKTD